MKKILVAFTLLTLILACEKSLNTPLSEQQLIDLLADMHSAEAATESEVSRVRDSMTKIYYQQIFDKHGVKKADFDTTLALYSRNPVALDTVYSRVIRKLSELEVKSRTNQ